MNLALDSKPNPKPRHSFRFPNGKQQLCMNEMNLRATFVCVYDNLAVSSYVGLHVSMCMNVVKVHVTVREVADEVLQHAYPSF